MTRTLLMSGLAAACLAAAASAAQGATAYPPVPYEAGPEAFLPRLTSDAPGNRVLNDMEVGARAFWRGDYATAKPALDDAILRIGAVFDKDENAAKARKLWYDEGSKDFKGEPYERAMVFYYRGLIYLQEADYENARAAFRQGLMQDAFAEEDQNRSDFAVLLMLDAWASHLNGDKDLEAETLQQLKALRPAFGGFGEKDDTLVLLETGQGPRKLGDGADHAYFVYRRGKPILENGVVVLRGDASLQAFPMEDIFFQAATRGGREIDKILQGKAQFKSTTGGVGSFLADTTVALQNGQAAFGGSSQLGTATAVAGGIAGVFLIISSNAKPAADVRTWSSLPDTVHVLTFSAADNPAGPAPALTARFLKNGMPVPGEEKPIPCKADANGKQLCLVRAH